MNKNDRRNEIVGTIYFFVLVIAAIYAFYISINKVYFLVIASIAILIYISFKLCSIAINKDIVEKQDKGLIYVRDIEVDYSPAVVSYLVNQKLEVKKDVMATILNLCVKKVLKIDSDGIQGIENIEVDKKLTNDEKYIYDCITKKQKFDKNKWYKIVTEEFNSLGFVHQKREITFYEYLLMVAVFSLITFVLYAILGQEIVLPILGVGIIGIIVIINKTIIKQSYMKYTKKGAIELMKWDRFKAFFKDFTLINEASLDKVVLLEKYLSYGMALNISKKYSLKIMDELNINLEISIIDAIRKEFGVWFLGEV